MPSFIYFLPRFSYLLSLSLFFDLLPPPCPFPSSTHTLFFYLTSPFSFLSPTQTHITHSLSPPPFLCFFFTPKHLFLIQRQKHNKNSMKRQYSKDKRTRWNRPRSAEQRERRQEQKWIWTKEGKERRWKGAEGGGEC